MVSYPAIQLSNSLIKSTLPANLTAVFAGGTNGVGETTLKQFAKHTLQPRIYILGRSETAGERIVSECKLLNPDGDYIFISGDLSIIRNVDDICEEISKKEEKGINVLFLSIGTLRSGIETEEGLHFLTALTIHARNRLISNLLPRILQTESPLRRIITVYGAGFEGKIHLEDFQSRGLNRIAEQAHLSSIITLDLLSHQTSAEQVSFIHAFPGAVESGIARGNIGPLMRTLKTIWGVLGSWVHIPIEEAGERHLFFCTSARFPAAATTTAATVQDGKMAAGIGNDGVPLSGGMEICKGLVDGEGAGVYSVDEKGESIGVKTRGVISEFVRVGMVEKVQGRIKEDIDAALEVSRKSRGD